MSGTGTRRSPHQKCTINCSTGVWSTPLQLGRLGQSGLLARTVLRAPAGTSSTAASIMIWEGGDTDDVDITNPLTTVPTEDRVLYRTGIVVAGSAVDADDDYNILADKAGAPYDVRAYAADGDSKLWCSVLSTGNETAMRFCVWSVDTL